MQFYWVALYRDGSYLIEGKYMDIDRSKLLGFALVNAETGKPHVGFQLLPGQKLIYRRRHLKHIPVSQLFWKNDPNRSVEEDIHILGFQEHDRGVNKQTIAFVFEDGRIELMDRFKDVEPFTPIVFLDCEKIEEQRKLQASMDVNVG